MGYRNRTNKDLPMTGLNKRCVAIYLLGMARFYKNGDGWSALFRWWHPLNIILVILLSLIFPLWTELSVQSIFKEFFILGDYWKSRKDKMEFFKLSYLKYYEKEEK